ncbi:MAG TPA: 2-oxoglutarate dehydrogenase E1 component [Vicinamibacterales bacterium]
MKGRDFHGVNAGYVAELYERYRQDPASVDPATREAFESGFVPAESLRGEQAVPLVGAVDVAAVVGAVNLAECIRKYGHLNARLDPLGTRPVGDPSLAPEAHGLTEDMLRRLPASLIGGPIAADVETAWDAIQALRRVYESTTGYDYAHVFVPEERDWLRTAAEAGQFRPPARPIDGVALLDRLSQVEAFELFLHRAFPGKTRFSVEGLDLLIPILDTIVDAAGAAGIGDVLIGMAHRGRLNVLAHVLSKPYAQILAEFKDPVQTRTGYRIDLGWAGDVKYHAGAVRSMKSLTVSMAPNPSHLEFVNPVVEGMARAAGTRVDRPGPVTFDPSRTLPILIHGDAAFPGQGIVAETLNLARLEGYDTGGTIHIIVNNQLGFTATSKESYGTSYASGLARGFKIPIVHVNADDPIACIEAARLASAYRARFRRDFLIDLIGYRRHGHNEGDEPSFTQPLLYEKIAKHPTVRQIWANELVSRGELPEGEPEAMMRRHFTVLEETLASLKPERDLVEPIPEPPPPGAARQVRTAVPAERLRALNAALLQRPEGFNQHRKLDRARERRKVMLDTLDERTIDWATAEELAFASILEDGIAIRLTGEDVERGTFSHRHAVFHDVVTGKKHVPLQALPQARAAFEIHNSPLTENATVGFEFGYNVQAPERLVIWEAQYGDFINGAQVIIDEFITSGRAKWGLTPSLVLLLPHGYEGQGPDHSSARVERFLEAAADINIRIANCTTAAQYFHLLRRQALLLDTDPLPLVVLTPKSLLRHPMVASSLREFSEGRWQPAIDDVEARSRAADVRRLILCSGKVYVDLVSSEMRAKTPSVAIGRIEQLYPFPAEEVAQMLAGYPQLQEVIWLQEEPQNMGAWTFMREQLETLVGGRVPVSYIGRPRSASPSEGSSALHAIHQRMIVDQAFAVNVPVEAR